MQTEQTNNEKYCTKIVFKNKKYKSLYGLVVKSKDNEIVLKTARNLILLDMNDIDYLVPTSRPFKVGDFRGL